MLSSFSSTLWDNNAKQFDPDRLAFIIGEQLVAYLNSKDAHLFEVKDFPQIEEYYYSADNNMQILVFAYHSGGTAGSIYKPIIISNLRRDNQKAYNITNTECGIGEMHKLAEEIYLCIGYTHGSSTCFAKKIFVIDFSNGSINFKEVFSGEKSFVICNADINFNKENKLLIIEVDQFPAYADDCEFYFSGNSAQSFIINCDNENKVATLRSRFDGYKFVKPF